MCFQSEKKGRKYRQIDFPSVRVYGSMWFLSTNITSKMYRTSVLTRMVVFSRVFSRVRLCFISTHKLPFWYDYFVSAEGTDFSKRLLALWGGRIVAVAYFHHSRTTNLSNWKEAWISEQCCRRTSHSYLKGHNSGLRTWFKISTQITFSMDNSLSLERSSLFVCNLVSFDETCGQFQWRSE